MHVFFCHLACSEEINSSLPGTFHLRGTLRIFQQLQIRYTILSKLDKDSVWKINRIVNTLLLG